MPTLQTYKDVYLWKYVPNLPVAIVFLILFVIATAAHSWKMTTKKMWFCIPFVIGGVFEIIGYICRVAAYNSTGSLIIFILQAIFLLLPAVFYAASLYMVYSRIVRAVHGEDFSITSPRWATRIFVTGDFLSLTIQSNGSPLTSNDNPKTVDIGNYIIIAGLALQVVMFIGFGVCCYIFNKRFRAHLNKTGSITDVPWQSSLNMLYSTSFLILVRSIYRVAEFVLGQDGYLIVNEWPFYVFDGALMFLVMAIFFIWYPDQLQPSTRDSMIELTSDRANSAECVRV
ncbi:hypothetical protein G7046_g1792 [Stylonectria norvegica]|nr:hypothetical protein G7046_g1792 [Stylonectria norvegica]